MPVSPDASICVGDSATFEAEIVADVDQNYFTAYWKHKGGSNVEDGFHFSITTNFNETVLDVHDALPSHSGVYEAVAYTVYNGYNVFTDNASFTLEVHGKIFIIGNILLPFPENTTELSVPFVHAYYRNL